MSRAWKGGSTPAHRRARALVLSDNLANNKGMCTLQIEGVCTGTADQAHHVYGKGLTGDDPIHMVAACGACNLKVGDPMRHDPMPRPVSRW